MQWLSVRISSAAGEIVEMSVVRQVGFGDLC